ncbi:MAG: aldo/keto reductase [Clostridia bacterium]|nr:aldo/keto reductase [Clostridia bacterium]
MKYTDFLGERVSLLGFGAMRFPTVKVGDKTEVDLPLTEKMIDLAVESGVNYFDTAYPYHRGESERIIGKLLSKYPRESYHLATKYPGHQLMDSYDPGEIFEEQLSKCGVDYFDFYLLHNVYENSMDTYLDKRWGIIDYFLEEKRRGRIRHLGFSSHGTPENLREFLERTGGAMEFCQIQYNYLDDSLQRADEKCKILDEYGIPIIVMEPVRGGKLATLPDPCTEKLSQLRPGASAASFAFRWLFHNPSVKVVLSGMSNMEQLVDNIRTFTEYVQLSAEERELLGIIAEQLKCSVPCTACRYCTDGCPAGLDIPSLIEIYNDLACAKSLNTAMRVEFLPDDKKPSACISCGKCTEICPQRIAIPKVMSKLCNILTTIPSWRDISREREEDAARMREANKH